SAAQVALGGGQQVFLVELLARVIAQREQVAGLRAAGVGGAVVAGARGGQRLGAHAGVVLAHVRVAVRAGEVEGGVGRRRLVAVAGVRREQRGLRRERVVVGQLEGGAVHAAHRPER